MRRADVKASAVLEERATEPAARSASRVVHVSTSRAGVKPGEMKIPHDAVNEQVVIAAAIVGGRETRKRLLGQIPADAFFTKQHPAAWLSLAEIERRGLEYDQATIQQLTGDATLGTYLEELARARPEVPPNLAHHVECMLWDQTRIEAARGPVSGLVEALRNPRTEPDRVRALSRQIERALESRAPRRYLRDPVALVQQAMAEMRRRRDEVACYPYGVDGLDVVPNGEPKAGATRIIPGAAPGKVTVVTATPGSGKSTLTAHIAIAQANMSRRVLYGAWEMNSPTTLETLAIISLGISRTRASVGDLTDEEFERIEAEMARLSEFIRFMDLPFGRARGDKPSNDRNLDLVQSYISDTGCDVFIADLWRRCLARFEPDEEEAALYRQQAIAEETRTHCILVHQQRAKDVEGRDDRRPTRDGIKGSGAWIEVPDTIIAPYRPALWKNVPDDVIEIIVLKQRYGEWPIAIECTWDPEFGTIKDGRTVEVVRPGQLSESEQALLGETTPVRAGRPKGGKGWKRGN